MKPLISIVIPVYQIVDYLSTCIESCIRQTYTNLEIVIVDDGSDDGGEKICDRYADIDDRVTVIHQKNRGLVSARKLGIENVHGNFIMYVDGDDFIDPDYVEKMAEGITYDTDIVWDVNYIREYGNESINAGLSRNLDLNNLKNQREIYDYTIGKEGFQNEVNYVIYSKLYRTDFFSPIQKSVSDDVRILEDIACVCRCLAVTDKVLFKQIGGYHYLQRPGSISSEKQCSIGALNPFFEDTLDYFKNKNIHNEIILNQLKGWYGSSLLRWGYIDSFNKVRSEYLIPFTCLKRNSRIVIYGLGKVGVHFLEYFLESKDFDVVACSDKRKIDSECLGVPFMKLQDIDDETYDYIVIASNITSFIREIEKELIAYGICTKKIVAVDFDKIKKYSVEELLGLNKS